MDTKGLQKEFINWCKSNNKSPKSEDETKLLFVAFMKEKHPEEYKQALLNQLNKAKKAAHGAKLNYFKSLKNQCAEDEEVVYYKQGGSVSCGCKKKEDGGQVNKASIGGIVERFKNRAKQKFEEAKKLADKKESDKAFKEHRMIPGKHLPRGNDNVTEAERKDVTRDKCGSKIKKHQEGSVIVKFKALRNGGSLNRIPFMLGGTPKGGVQLRYNEFSGWDLVPVVGTYRDIVRAYDNPTAGNIGQAVLSAGSDILGGGIVGSLAKAAGKYGKVSKLLRNSGFFRPTGTGTQWIKVSSKPEMPRPGYITGTKPQVLVKNVPEVDFAPIVSYTLADPTARMVEHSTLPTYKK